MSINDQHNLYQPIESSKIECTKAKRVSMIPVPIDKLSEVSNINYYDQPLILVKAINDIDILCKNLTVCYKHICSQVGTNNTSKLINKYGAIFQ